MSDHLREDKECQNCGRTVEEIYCPRCGQKNTETRQSFAHLVAHFAEDFTHYDGAFWRTIKYLMFRPAFLTKEYLLGKRQRYVPPVKLYIFISFIAFFLPGLIPGSSSEADLDTSTFEQILGKKEVSIQKKLSTKADVYITGVNIKDRKFTFHNPLYYNSLKEMDSIEKVKPENLKLSPLEYKMGKRLLMLYTQKTPAEASEQFTSSFTKAIPKTLFIYLPFFAFLLWLIHGKKRWFFFDHAIFTLHYFSFLLLVNSLLTILWKIFNPLDIELIDIPLFVTLLATLIWQVYYFYRGHRKMYHESWFINFIKSTALFAVNLLLIFFVVAIVTYITFYSIH